jgi:hypothetical protein
MRRIGAALGALLVLAGCAGSGGDGRDLRISLAVEDKNIRAEGDECAGARPFGYVHAEAGYALEDGSGDVLEQGTLPAGHAVNADPSIDWGVERIPTFCVFELELDGVPPRETYALRLAEGNPLPFDGSRAEGGEPVELVLP